MSVSDNNNYYNGSMISDRTEENSDPHCLNMNCLDENFYKFFHLRFVLFGPAGKVELYWHLNFRFLNSEPLMILSIVELALFSNGIDFGSCWGLLGATVASDHARPTRYPNLVVPPIPGI